MPYLNPWLNFLFARITLLSPAFFPDAVRLLTILFTAITWVLIIYFVIGYFATQQASEKVAKHEDNVSRLDAQGRIVGCLVTLCLFLPAIGLGIGISPFILEWTSFTKNGRSYTVYSSKPDGNLPSEYVSAALKVGFAAGDDYECMFQPLICGNLPGNTKVAFLPDGRVAVLGKFKKKNEFRRLIPIRVSIEECPVDQRFQIRIEEKGTTPHLGHGWRMENW